MDGSLFVGAGLSIGGAILGASLQYLFSRSNDHRRQLAEFRSKAYCDYLDAIAMIASAYRSNEPVEPIWRRIAAAKTKITLYGSKNVIESLAAFERQDPRLDTSAGQANFLSVVRRMRTDSGSQGTNVQPPDLAVVLFGTPPKQQIEE